MAEEILTAQENEEENLSEQMRVRREKLKELQESIDNKDKTQAEIKKQESDLEWMNGIIDRVNNLINF